MAHPPQRLPQRNLPAEVVLFEVRGRPHGPQCHQLQDFFVTCARNAYEDAPRLYKYGDLSGLETFLDYQVGEDGNTYGYPNNLISMR